jgi:hypothetical protein
MFIENLDKNKIRNYILYDGTEILPRLIIITNVRIIQLYTLGLFYLLHEHDSFIVLNTRSSLDIP